MLHQKTYTITLFSTAKALVGASLGKHCEGWRVLGMERTAGDQVHTSSLQGDELANNLFDVRYIENLIYSILWYHSFLVQHYP